MKLLGPPQYAPLFFFLLSPFMTDNFKLATILWTIFNHLLLIWSLFILFHLIEKFEIADTFTGKILVIFLFLSSQPLLENICVGQVNILILLLLLLMIKFYNKNVLFVQKH